MSIRLITFGGLRAFEDDDELEWMASQRLRAALFVYLAIEGRASRAGATTIFWPDSDDAHSRQALRQSLYQLRKSLRTPWVESKGHDLEVTAEVWTDARAFTKALERGEPESAARLYGGTFLEGVHLVDAVGWERWVGGRSAEYARGFRQACREWLESRRGAGDLDGALEAARHWVGPDPLDDEAQHGLIQALVEMHERTEAIRQYETYLQLLEPEGLRPLEHTEQLIERVRSDPPNWPGLEVGNSREAPTPPMATEGPASGFPPAPPTTIETPEPEAPQAIELQSLRSDGGAPHPRERSAPVGHRRAAAFIGLVGLVLLFGGLSLAGIRWGPDRMGWPTATGGAENGSALVLADFQGPDDDPGLGTVVTEALRIDLVQADVLHVLDRGEVREVLARMRADEGVLTPPIAREVALRAGVGTVLEGSISRAGGGYVLTASLRSAETDAVLAAFRENANTPDDVIPAINRMSRAVRRRAGESVRAAGVVPPLKDVTTPSLAALRAYNEADHALGRREYGEAIRRLEDALAHDPEFAMAWRLLASALANAGQDRLRVVEAATRAYELRDRLSVRESHLAAAAFHDQVAADRDAARDAYLRALELNRRDQVALNNLAANLHRRGDFEGSVETLRRVVDDLQPARLHYLNLVYSLIGLGDVAEALAMVEEVEARFPGRNLAMTSAKFWALFRSGNESGAIAEIKALLENRDGFSPDDLAWAHDNLGRVALWQGRLQEARQHFVRAENVAGATGAAGAALRWRGRIVRAHVEVLVGDSQAGVDLLREAAEEEWFADVPPADRLHHLHAAILARAGLLDEAEEILRRFRREVPEQMHQFFHTRNESAGALLLMGRGDPEGALAALQRVREGEPCRFCLAKRTGAAFFEAGRLEEAAREWEAALAWKDDSFYSMSAQIPQNLWVIQRLPALYEELGETDRALTYYRRLVDMWADADEELQPVVSTARARIAALEGNRRRATRF